MGRYYEKYGFDKKYQRNPVVHAVFNTKKEVRLGLVLLFVWKKTGMALEIYCSNANLREVGVMTVFERQQLLERH